MHLIQITDKQWINAEKIAEIQENSSVSLLIILDNGDSYYIYDDYRDRAVIDILPICTQTSGRDALQGMVSE